MGTQILVILVLMLLNGVFAGAEIAVISVRKTRLSELQEQRARGARAVAWLRQQPERFLATVQIGITFVTTAAAAFGGETLAYRQLTAEGDPWFGPLRTHVVRDPSQPAALEVELAFLNQLPAGWFKVASYNPYGTSKPSSGQSFIAAAGS